jgi:Spy/CpxP family protein refolding chaperone
MIMNRWIKITLAISLTFNLLLAGGYLYKRFVVYPHMQAEWATETLHLNAVQQAELQQLGAWTRNEIKVAINDLRPDIAIAKSIVSEGKADDAQLAESMRRINERRLKLQMDALKKLFAFRDSLTPEQRQTFTRLSGERGFALRLIGLSPLAERLPQ